MLLATRFKSRCQALSPLWCYQLIWHVQTYDGKYKSLCQAWCRLRTLGSRQQRGGVEVWLNLVERGAHLGQRRIGPAFMGTFTNFAGWTFRHAPLLLESASSPGPIVDMQLLYPLVIAQDTCPALRTSFSSRAFSAA